MQSLANKPIITKTSSLLLTLFAGMNFIATTAFANDDYEEFPDENSELRAIRNNPTLAKRTPQGLTLFYKNEPFKFFETKKCDFETDEECSNIYFNGGVKLYNPHTEEIETLPITFSIGYEWYIYEVYGPKDIYFNLDSMPIAAKDGKHFATGQIVIDEMTGGGQLSIYNSSEVNKYISFEIPCRPLEWTNNVTLNVSCTVYDDNYNNIKFAAKVTPDAKNKWKLTPIREGKGIQSVYYPVENDN